MISDRQYRALLRQELRATTITLVIMVAVMAAEAAVLVTSWHTPWLWAHLVVLLSLGVVLPCIWEERRRLLRTIEDLHDA